MLIKENNFWDSKRVEFNDNIIKDEDKKLIDSVVDRFHEYSATDLVSLTHEQTPWINAYKRYENNEITTKAIKEYFDE